MKPFENNLRFHRINILGLERDLDIREPENNRGHFIASNHSVVPGDVEFISKTSKALASKLEKFSPELLLTAESKSIFLAGKIAGQLHLISKWQENPRNI